MKRFLINIIAFFCISLLIWISIEIIVYKKLTKFSITKEYLEENASSIEIVFLGSSQTKQLIDPCLISTKKAINLATDGGDLRIDSMMLQSSLDRFPRLEMVVLECSYHTLESFRTRDHESSPMILRAYGVDSQGGFNPLRYSIIYSGPKDIMKTLLPDYVPAKVSECGVRNGIGEEVRDNERFRKLEYDEEKIAANKDNLYIKRHKNRNPERALENSKRLSNMLEQCSESGVTVVLLRPPLYRTYLEERIPDKTELTDSLIYKLKSENLIYDIIDFNTIADFEVSDFINEDHVNYRGAVKASSIIDDYFRHASKKSNH